MVGPEICTRINFICEGIGKAYYILHGDHVISKKALKGYHLDPPSPQG